MSGVLARHSFRDEAPLKPQLKIKCTSCGCWVTRGGRCSHCGTRGAIRPPNSRAAGEALSRSASVIGTTTRRHSFREEAASKPQKKIKCSSCGCWAIRGGNCYYCKTRVASTPPNSKAASESMARTPTRITSAQNHLFREESAKKPQAKIKCTACGCWAQRGGDCYFCKTPADLFPPSASAASESISRTLSGMRCGMNPPSTHVFREESPMAPQLKVKCSSCGCWASRGGICSFCKTQVATCPPSSTSAGDSLARQPSGMSVIAEPHFFNFRSSSAPGSLLVSPRSAGTFSPRISPRSSPQQQTRFQPPARSTSTQKFSTTGFKNRALSS